MKKKPLIFTVISIFAIFVLAYIGGSKYYDNHFLPNSKIGEIDVGGKTLDEAKRVVTQKLHASTIIVTEDGKTVTNVTPQDLDAKIDSDTFLGELKSQQNSWSWPLAFFNTHTVKASEVAIQFDEKAVFELIEKLTLSKVDRIAPVSANVKNKDGQFVIEEEVPGTIIDADRFEEQLIATMVAGEETLALEDAYVLPELTADSQDLTQVVETMRDLADTNITYTIIGEEIAVPKDQIASWLSLDNSGKPTVNKEAAKAFLKTLHDKYATYEKTRTFKSTNRGEVQVPPGEYGWSIAMEAESENLAGYILAGEDVKTTPEILGSGYHEDGTDIGDTYVEVDLQNQKMYVYKNGKRELETPIVSGHATTPTPVGVFYAWNKEEDAELIGYNPRRGNDYAQPVNYWIPVDWTGVGIHDAGWQTSFAPDQWKHDGSNGCINTPPGAMEKLFSLIEVGTPVVFF
ncbi:MULTISPECIES: L,D-transpeptidase family protein [unclassified Jeotgalibaca]|uniref:L,D-transpeptidase family protein n=1 Tax=unclassified Jeotgalibaca TaxID=2621505 RepID=UPI003FD5096F